jgi:gas vesicle protein
MSKEVKSEIYQLIDSIKDENILQMVMEDVAYYASDKDVTEELSKDQLKELDEAISEANRNDTMDWSDLKKEMNEWKKR